jgi:hypothetical protein
LVTILGKTLFSAAALSALLLGAGTAELVSNLTTGFSPSVALLLLISLALLLEDCLAALLKLLALLAAFGRSLVLWTGFRDFSCC